MATIAIASKQTASDTDGTLTITAPSGVTVSNTNILVAVLYDNTDTDWETLSGWTKLGSAKESSSGAANVTILAKHPDSGDAAAANFTFQSTDISPDAQFGVLMRITTTGSFDATLANNFVIDTDSDDAGGSFAGGVDPNKVNTLLLLGAVCNDPSVDVTGGAVTNSNPSWTSQAVGSNSSLRYTLASATFAPETTTGAYSVTTSATVGGFLLSINDSGNVTVTLDTLSLTGTPNDMASVTGGATVTLDSLSLTATPNDVTATGGTAKWVNTDKSSAGAITNTDKS